MGINILENQPLGPYTSFKIGGRSDYFVKVKNQKDLKEAIKVSKKLKTPYFILGGGTNILISDKGYRGMVIKIEMDKIRVKGYSGNIRSQSAIKNIYLEVNSGVLVNRLVRYALDKGFSGLENFLGQPGTVGGAIYMNAHSLSGKEFFGNLLIKADILSPSGKVKTVDNSYFEFSYDKSKIQKTKEIVLSCVLKLKKLKDKQKELWKKANKIMSHRQKTQPFGVGSSGCIFQNISKKQALKIKTSQLTCSSGFLLDACGLKGKEQGKAVISKTHANFIINLGGASSSDVVKLIEFAKKKVKDKFGIKLKEEIIRVGEF